MFPGRPSRTILCACLLAAASAGTPLALGAQARFAVVPVGPLVYRVIAASDVGTRGGEIGLAFDGRILRLLAVEPGPDFPAGSGDLRVDMAPADHCPLGGEVTAGFTAGWIYSSIGVLELAPGGREVLTVRFERVPGAPAEACSPLRFVDCLGVAEAPAGNVLVARGGESLLAMTSDGATCGAACSVLKLPLAQPATCDRFNLEVRGGPAGPALASRTIEARGLNGYDLRYRILDAFGPSPAPDLNVGLTADGVSFCRPSGAGVSLWIDGKEVPAGQPLNACGIDFRSGVPRRISGR